MTKVLDPRELRTQVDIGDVISHLYDRPLYANGSSELRCHCWRKGHPDTVPSCRINVEKQVFYCDVCSSGGDCFTVVRERFGKPFRDTVQWLAEHRMPPAIIQPLPRTKAAAKGATVIGGGERAIYPYYDKDWTVLFEKIRTPDKQFFYRHRDGRNRFVWGLGDIEPVLYLLPALKGASFVLVVEGEKDVETAWDHDLPATTNPEGAGNGKWKARYTQQLRWTGVERVYVIPDNDSVGRLHARQIVASCRKAGLRAVFIPLPGVPKHGDLSDYFAMGHTRRDVFRLMRQV